MGTRTIAALCFLVSASAAQATELPLTPYAGQQARPIKALSDADLAALRKGEGMGMAKAAELNGYPGPTHVLQMAAVLQLTPDQNVQITEIHARMSAAAKPLGAEIIEREQSLDQLFAEGRISPDVLAAAITAIGELQGRLRTVHLAAHLETRALLTPEQIGRYQQLPGYGEPAAAPHQHRHG